jgi:hypothetical protein
MFPVNFLMRTRAGDALRGLHRRLCLCRKSFRLHNSVYTLIWSKRLRIQNNLRSKIIHLPGCGNCNSRLSAALRPAVESERLFLQNSLL